MGERRLPFTVRQLIEMDGCARCELCKDACSVLNLTKVNPHPLNYPISFAALLREFRSLIKRQYGLLSKLLRLSPKPEKLWECAEGAFLRCTLCGRCMVLCPLGINTHSMIVSMRRYFVENVDIVPETVRKVIGVIREHKNVFGLDNSMRLDWQYYTGIELDVKDKADVVYFVGCVSSYSGKAQDIAAAIASILDHVGERWTVLGDEWCCGHPATISGFLREARELAEHNVKMIKSIGAKIVVTGCPGCYLALKHEWPEVLGADPGFEVLHITEYLYRLIKRGKLKLPKLEDAKVTYHDPCELGRLGGVIHEPRFILKEMSVRLVEPEGSGLEGYCCGSGGLLKVTNPLLSSKLADERFRTLTQTGAATVVTACPSCVLALWQAASKLKASVQVLDIAQLVARQLGLV